MPSLVVFIEIQDLTLRDSLAAFLDAGFGGSVFDREDGIELGFPLPTMPPSVQLRITERLLWAWHQGLDLAGDIDVTLTVPAMPEAEGGASQPQTIALRLDG